MFFHDEIPRTRAARSRRGVVLLVVIALLTLFAAVGLSFVYYAEAEAAVARVSAEAQRSRQPDVDPEFLLGYFLNQLLFDAKDDATGAYSSLRGHSLLRSMWGAPYDINSNGTVDLANTTVAFHGTGRLQSIYPKNAPAPLQAQDDQRLINYTYFPADGFVRDPEREGLRANLNTPRGAYLGGVHAPYTYPDLNNMYLGAVKADGTLLAPSFHRPWLFGSLDAANPNWTNPQGKYLLLRPRPHEHPPLGDKPGFPYPEDATGDVKNGNGPGGNDSVWLDLDFPVRTHADGRKYKPMFAALIVDLDGKVNVNAHGNVRGAGGAHAANQGWGPWEVNLNRVLNEDAEEWKNLFVGASSGGATARGRYGPDKQPTPYPFVAQANFGGQPRQHTPVDFDGCRADGKPSALLTLPQGVDCFPATPAGYDNAGPAELANHPALYNIVGPLGKSGAAYDRRFAAADIEAGLRFADTGSPSMLSELFELCPKNFNNNRRRRLVTTHSSDLRRPGLAPFFWDNLPYANVARTGRYPSAPEKLLGGGVRPFPDQPNAPKLFDDFQRVGRAGDLALTRVDLNRPLPGYPTPDAVTGQMNNPLAFAVAQSARQQLARDIFVRLVKATGAYDPTCYLASSTTILASPPSDTELQTLRWLAQYAVNLVDAVDGDDVSTPFPWGRQTGSPAFTAQFAQEWAFGVELPHVVLNEAYGEYVNEVGETGKDAMDKGKIATRYNVNVWLELLNPLRGEASLPYGGAARLASAYQIVLSQPNRQLMSSLDLRNTLGDPDNTTPVQTYDPTHVYSVLNNFNPPTIAPADQAGQGFYVIGPPMPAPGESAWEPNFGTLRTPALTYQVKIGPGQVLTPPAPAILLRRLACPYLPWQPNPAADSPGSPYNPYVTVDYLDGVPLNRGASNNGVGVFAQPLPIAKRQSHGRLQPYDGHSQMLLPQVPQHTMFAHNRDGVFEDRPAYDWLIHFDRPLVSPLEALHVACCRPHQLTHLFKDTLNNGYQSHNHAPYWLVHDGNSPLHRALELFETGCRSGGAGTSDAVPGKINLNTVWDPETFLALCDPQPANGFSAADVQQIYQWMSASRTPGGQPGANDRPFKGLASAQFNTTGNRIGEGNGLDDTILRANPSHPQYDAQSRPIRLFEIVKQGLQGKTIQDHPYHRYELLNKIFNNVTTRSHVFAVWVTVGFFEVNDDSVRPAKLGAEIGRAENRHVRHRMFAVLDRSALVRLFSVSAAAPVGGPGPATVTPTFMRDPNPQASNGQYTWSIQPGMILRVTGDDGAGGTATDDVVVAAVTSTSFTATFSRAYPGGLTTIEAFGNPGPRPRAFHPAQLPDLVMHYSVIQ